MPVVAQLHSFWHKMGKFCIVESIFILTPSFQLPKSYKLLKIIRTTEIMIKMTKRMMMMIMMMNSVMTEWDTLWEWWEEALIGVFKTMSLIDLVVNFGDLLGDFNTYLQQKILQMIHEESMVEIYNQSQ